MNKRIIILISTFFITQLLAQDITDGCDLPENPLGGGYLHLTADGAVLYKSPEAIAGWQFNVEGATVNSASGGDTQAAGLIINASGDMVLAFSLSGGSIPAGCGTLVELDLNGEATGLINLVFSDTNAQGIYFEYYAGGDEPVLGCTDMNACNYNADATEDDGSCDYAEENYDCDGNCTAGEDCAGECGGSAVNDACGVCNGDGPEMCWECGF